MRFAEMIRCYIESKHISMHEVERQSGVDVSAISRFLAGQRGVSAENLVKLWAWSMGVEAPAAGESQLERRIAVIEEQMKAQTV